MICGVDPASVVEFELVNVHAVVPLGVPTPKPTATVAERVESVRLTVPACATVNVNRLEPCTASVPANVSVAFVDEVVVDGDVRSLRRLHPALGTAALNATASAIPKRPRQAYRRCDDSDMSLLIIGALDVSNGRLDVKNV